MSKFENREQFIDAQTSEKLTLAQIEAKARLYTFSGPVMSIYSKQVPYFVCGLKQDDTVFTQVNDLLSVTPGTWFYDIKESTLYFRALADVDPTTVEIIVTYKFFYSEKGITCTHNLENIGDEVFYDGRVVSSPGYKHKIGIDQKLTSLVGEGTLKLKNQDGGLDNKFDKLIFENQDVTIYSWNPKLPPADARVIYRGKVTNKTYDGINVNLKIKDQIFNLLDAPQIDAYTADDNVGESAQGQYKRRVYGRVDGLKCQSISEIANGIPLTGTVFAAANSDILSGTGTQFFTETLQNDTIIIGTQEFEIEEVISDTEIRLSDETDFGFSGATALLKSERGNTLRNREYLAAGHACAEVTHTVVNPLQFNRIVLDSTEGLFAGDFVEFVVTGERIEIKTVAPGNIIVLQQSVITLPPAGSQAIRRPIQEVYIGKQRVNADDYSVFNSPSGTGLIFQDDAEFNLARPRNTVFTGTFTNGSRTVAIPTSEVSLDEIFQPGDWVKPDDIDYTVFYKVVNVKDAELTLATVFADPTITDILEIKKPDYLVDDSIVSVNILGRTKDGTPTGEWIQTVADAEFDLIGDLNLQAINTASFAQGASDMPQLVSIAIPESFDSKSLPNVKEIVDKLNKSVNSSLTLDNDLALKYQALNVYSGQDLIEIKDSDVIEWKIKSTNGQTYRTALGRYRFTDVDLNTLEDGNKLYTFESEFVKNYIGTSKQEELDLYLYEEFDAKIATHRFLYYNRLGTATLTVTTDLRLENVEIGDVVIADFERLYKRYGDEDFRKKLMLVIGKTLTGERTELILSDLGNTFNTSSYITPNDAPDYADATPQQKLLYGYITDGQGIVNNDENTAGVHKIS